MTDSRLARELKGDLDWIVLKALEKEPARRYDSAMSLAEELERYLTLMPVTARPPTLVYRLAKLARRRRGGMIAAAAIVLLALAGGAGTIGALIQARRAEREAVAAAATARREASVSAAISAFLNQDLLAAASPRGAGRESTVRAALERAAATLDGKFSEYPEVEAALRLTLGRTFRHLDEPDRAETQLLRAVALGKHALAPGARTTLESLHELGLTFTEQRRFVNALQVFDAVLAADPQRGQSNESLGALQGKALVFLRLNRNAEALPVLQDVIVRKLVIAPNDVNLPRLRNLLGTAYLNMGLSHEALAELTEAERSSQRIAGPDSQDTLKTQSGLCDARIELGQYADAEAVCALAIEGSRGVNGADHNDTLLAEASLARLRYGQGNHQEAEAILRQILAVRRERAGLPLTGSAVEAATPVACGDVLSEPGGSYYLPGDISCESPFGSPAVWITADGVRFDLRGHRMSEVTGNSAGIKVGVGCSPDAIPRSGIQITNGIVQANRVKGFGVDLRDLSTLCDSNTWKANQFGTATPACLK